MQKLKELKEKGSSLDSKTFSQEFSSWQDKYCVTNFPEKLQTEINEITATLLKSIHEKAQEETALEQLQTVLTSSSENNPLDSIASILSQYDYTHFSEDAKKQIEIITQKAVSLNENLNLAFNIDEEYINTISKNSTTTIQFRALSDLKDIFSKNPYDLEGILNWIYVNRKISFTEFARNEIIKQFVSTGYKIPPQSSYSIPDININLTYQNFSQINDDYKKNVILNFLGIIAQGNTLSTTGKDNLEEIHFTSEQESLVNETIPSASSKVLLVYDNIPEPSQTTENEIYDEKGSITEDAKDKIVLAIEDILDDSAITYEIPTSKASKVTTLSKEDVIVSEPGTPTEVLTNNSTEEKTISFEIPVYDTTKIINASSKDKTTRTSSSDSEKSSSSSSYTLSSEEKDKSSTTVSVLEEPSSSSSYTLSFEDQRNIEKINNESSYITIAYPIIFEALSRTQKTLSSKKRVEIEPEKNNGF